MHDLTPQRRPVQFSLRKLMLWTVVLAACLSTQGSVQDYLSTVPFVRMPNPQFVAVGFTMYLAALIPIRIIWGSERGALIAVLGTFLVLAITAEIHVVMTGYIADAILILVPLFIFAVFLSAPSFIFVHILVVAVDWIDSLFQRKPPQDQ